MLVIAALTAKRMASLGEQIAREMADGIDEKRHPERLGGQDEREVNRLACEKSRGPQPGEFFLLEDGALAGDFAGGIIRAHEGEQDHLEHHQSGDQAAHADGLQGE